MGFFSRSLILTYKLAFICLPVALNLLQSQCIVLTQLSNAVNPAKILANYFVCNTCLRLSCLLPWLVPMRWPAVPSSRPKLKEKKLGAWAVMISYYSPQLQTHRNPAKVKRAAWGTSWLFVKSDNRDLVEMTSR